VKKKRRRRRPRGARPLRTNYNSGAPATKILSGVRFDLAMTEKTKRAAVNNAKIFRAAGFRARTIDYPAESGGRGWAVYIRKKK